MATSFAPVQPTSLFVPSLHLHLNCTYTAYAVRVPLTDHAVFGNPLDTHTQLWDLGSGRLLTNLPWWQPEPDGCLPYAARFGTGAAAGLVVAGGSGAKPMVRVYKLVRAWLRQQL